MNLLLFHLMIKNLLQVYIQINYNLKLMTSNYNKIFLKNKNYIYEKIKIKEKEKDYIEKFSYTTEMFITKNI